MIKNNQTNFAIIIVNSIRPYGYEINNILSLPNGFSYRFRYQKKKQGNWMPEIGDPNALKNCKALIVLRDFQDTADLIPIRKIFIYDILIIGDIIYLEYTLQEKVELSSDLVKRAEQLSIFNKRIITDINITKYPNTPKDDLKNLIFFGQDYSYDISDENYSGNEVDKDSNRWGNIIETIGLYKNKGIEIYKDYDFLKIIAIQNEKEKHALIKAKKNKAYYNIENNRVYKILFLQRTYTGKSHVGDSSVITPRKVILKSANPDIIPLVSQKDILGKYDLIELTFKASIKNPSLKSFLILEINENNSKPILSINIPVRISYSRNEFFLNILSILFFVGLFFAYLYAEEIMLALDKNASNEILQNEVTNFKNILLPLMIVFGSNTFKRITSIKEFIFGRINL